MRRRRMQLGLKTAVELAEATGVTSRVIGDIENGRRRAGANTYFALEKALEYEPGSIDAFFRGEVDFPVEIPLAERRIWHPSGEKMTFGAHEQPDADRRIEIEDQVSRLGYIAASIAEGGQDPMVLADQHQALTERLVSVRHERMRLAVELASREAEETILVRELHRLSSALSSASAALEAQLQVAADDPDADEPDVDEPEDDTP